MQGKTAKICSGLHSYILSGESTNEVVVNVAIVWQTNS